MHTVGARVEKTSGKLTLLRWVALVVGSMIWVGAFNLPSDMSRDAGPGAIVIDWIITGVGVIVLAFVYRGLAAKARFSTLAPKPMSWARAGSSWLSKLGARPTV